ncbi:MAG: hypothetical protein ACT4PL_11890 [Phycisphaerales bacterium]
MASHSPIGLDLGSTTISAVQCRAGKVVRWCRFPRADLGAQPPAESGPAPRELSVPQAAVLAALLHRRGFVGRSVVVAAPPARQIVLPMQLPARTSGAPVEEIALCQLAEAARCDAAQLEHDWWVIPAARSAQPARPGSEATFAMGVGARRADVEALIDPIEAAGLEVLAVDVKSAALLRACRESLGPATGVTAILNLGDSGLGLVMVCASTVVYERGLPDLGLSALERAVVAGIGVEPDVARHVIIGSGLENNDPSAGERWTLLPQARQMMLAHVAAMAEETRVALEYAQSRFGGQVAPVVLAIGPGSTVPGLLRALAEQIGNIVITPRLAAPPGAPVLALAGARGLALHPAGPRAHAIKEAA